MSNRSEQLCKNRFVKEIMHCIHQKWPQNTSFGVKKLKRSLCKRLLEMALWPIREELESNEAFWKDLDSRTTLSVDYIFSFPFNGTNVNLYLPYIKDDFIQRHLGENRCFYENDLLQEVKRKYLKSGMVYLDCGANIGNHTLFFSLVADAKKIYAFEGNPDTCSILRKNVEINNLYQRCDVYNCVLGEHAGWAQIDSFNKDNIGGTSFKEANQGLEMKCLDEMDFLEKIDFVKMDVEGFENFVLKGMVNLLQKDKPVLWIEIFDKNKENVISLLKNMGYDMVESLGDCNYIFKQKHVE